MALARGVNAMLTEHWDRLEGDWSIYHHRDLAADAYGPNPIGVRKLRVYIEALPADSATARAMKWSWTERDEMGASQVEVLGDIARSTRQLVAMQTKSGRYAPKGEALMWPRPHVQVHPEKAPLTREGIRSSLLRGR